MSEPVSLESLGGPSGFRRNARFGQATASQQQSAPAAEPDIAAPAPDPIAMAYEEGFAAGCAAAEAQAAERAASDAAAREMLALSFARLDHDLQEELRLRLRDTVAALCETAIAPLALDEDALASRIERAVAMLARADDDRTIRLNPSDLAMIAPRMTAEWTVVADPALARGELRVESQLGGVEDGPSVWRRAIAEALHQC